MNIHKVPVHLDTEDKFLWGLTFRQVITLFAGGGAAYLVATTDLSTPLAASLCMLGGGLCLVVTFLMAFVRFRGRNLDQWLLVVFLFYSSPRVFYWATLLEEGQDTKGILKKEWTTEEKQGEDVW